ncbi:MAG: hypothetical protein JRF56_13270 [Deltaproteobacteria bacterium]|jgi:TRAP-type uncharacterized transport system substrate-binding protein|nr:hypothetical protein [Deltaproteobacteria bacterium]
MTAGLVAQFPGPAFGAKNYTFGSASAKGSWYPLAVAMAKVINDNVSGYNVTGVTTPGASRENILRIDRQEMELGWSSANILYKGHMGLDPFKRNANSSLSGRCQVLQAKRNHKVSSTLRGSVPGSEFRV